MSRLSNLTKYYIWQFIYGFYFIYTLQALYLLHKGITPIQLATFASVTALTSALLEIPTGFIADKFSRKLSVSLGFLCSGLAYLGLILVSNFYSLLVISFLLGLAESLKSGAEESLIYDDLKGNQKEDDYLKITSQGTSLATIIGALAAFLGPILYIFHSAIPFILTSIAQLILAALVLSFNENRNTSEVAQELKMISGIKIIWHNHYIRLIVLIDILLMIFVNIYYQVLFFPKISNLGLRIEYLGIIGAVSTGLLSIMLFILPKLALKSGKRNLVLYTVLPVIFFVLFALSNQLVPAIIFGVIFDLVWTARRQILPTITNIHFNSHNRAISISSMSFVTNIGAAILVPISLSIFTKNYIYTLIPATLVFFLLFKYSRTTTTKS